jgi:flagellar basal-body rod protein FlgF
VNYGHYLSASGMFSALHRMDTAANNLANAETTGFKPELAATMARQAVRPEDNVWNLPSDAMLEKLGGGVLMAPTTVDFTQGVLENAPGDLNVALKGEGFMTVRGDDGKPRLTRDGRFAISKHGTIVQANSGLPVLDDGLNPIRVASNSPDPIEIGADGSVNQGVTTVGRIAIVKPDDMRAVKKEGHTLYTLAPGATTSTPRGTEVVQHALERSGVDAITAMLEISDADRAVTMNGKMISIYDELMSRTVSTFGRLG